MMTVNFESNKNGRGKMLDFNYTKPEVISIKNHSELDERWIQDRIAEDPTIMGLGDIILKDKERYQPSGGRLDLLFQDIEEKQRYEVEIQLGATDEKHIIRTIEYWDIERKRYPQYEHCAVIVAEDITSRFLIVISLFNGFIHLIALQMSAVKMGDNFGLLFTKVLDQMSLGFVDEDEETATVADRGYWLNRASKETLALADQLFEMITEISPRQEMKYNKFYIGLAEDGKPNNFVHFKPKKGWVWFLFRLGQSSEINGELDESGLEYDYEKRGGFYRLKLKKADISQSKELISKYMNMAYENR